jgi:hypothetical protein
MENPPSLKNHHTNNHHHGKITLTDKRPSCKNHPHGKTIRTMKTYSWNNHAHGKSSLTKKLSLRRNYHTEKHLYVKITLTENTLMEKPMKFPNVRHACRFNFIHEFKCKFCVVFSSKSRVRCTHLILYCNDDTCVIMMEHIC